MIEYKQFELSEIAEIKSSGIDKKTRKNETKIRLCNFTDVYNNSFINSRLANDFMIATCTETEAVTFKLRQDQVAITKDSEKANDIGVPCYISENFDDVVLGYHLTLISPKKNKLDGKFLYYFLKSNYAKKYFENNCSGSGQRMTLIIDRIKSMPIKIPAFPVQKKIGQILFDFDMKIEINNEVTSKLEQIAKLTYEYWFNQFDFPNFKNKPYKSSGGNMVFNEEHNRKIPLNWKVGKFGSYCSIKSGYAFKSSCWEKTGFPVIKINDIGDDSFLEINDLSCVNEKIKEKSSRFEVSEGDIVIAMTGAKIGKFAMIPKNEKKFLINQRVGFYSLDDTNFSRLPFLLNSMKQKYFRKKILQTSGSAQPNISNDQLDDIQLLMPEEKYIDNYNEKFKESYKIISNNQFQNQNLIKIRDWLLPMLMNGQVTVK